MKPIEKFGYAFLMILLFLYSINLNAFGFMMLWKWFMVPLLHLPPLNFFSCMGILMVFGYVLNKNSEDKLETKEDFDDYLEKTFKRINIKVIVGIGIGWIIKCLM